MRKLLLLLCVAALGPALSASPQPLPRESLLDTLKTQLTAIRAGERTAGPAISRPDLSPLIGARRSDVSAALGIPDFCRGSPSNKCADARKWDFFYFKHPPKALNNGNTVEIQLTLGGWALVFDFDSANEVSEANWVRQE
jgi:hypothetical protein